MDTFVKQKKKQLNKILQDKDTIKNLTVIKDSYTKFIIPNIGTIINSIVKGFQFFIKIFLKPFWFSTSNGKKDIVVPYVYSMINQISIYVTIYVFLRLSWLTAMKELHNPEIVLPTIAGVLTALIALNHSTMSIYNNGKQTKHHINSENPDKPEGVQ